MVFKWSVDLGPLVSILIPSYNAEPWIAETLTSALAQTWVNIEIIVVDDGSTDHTLAAARKFASTRVQVISQPNGGASAARNRALKAAQGNYIQYLDADDLLEPDKIERQLELLVNGNPDWIASGAWARFFDHPSRSQFVPQMLWTDAAPVDWLVTAWTHHLMMHPAAWLVPRHISERAGPWDETLSLDDDGEYFSRVILASSMIKFCAAVKTYYRSGMAASLSGRRSPEALLSGYRSIELGCAHLLSQEDSARTRRTCAARYQRFIYEVYPAVPELMALAQAKVAALGGARAPVNGGPVFRLAASVVGWKLARRLQLFGYARGYKSIMGRRSDEGRLKAFYGVREARPSEGDEA